MTLPEDIAAMIERDKEEWLALTALLDAAGDSTVHAPGSPPWNARDVYAHLARWTQHSMDEFEARRESREPPANPPGTDDEINARWQAEDVGLSFAEARKRAYGAYERRLSLIRSLPSERWDETFRATAGADGYQHYESHRLYIETAGREGG